MGETHRGRSCIASRPGGGHRSPAAADAQAHQAQTMKSLVIVHTESSLGWGGQELRILSESRGLAERGHDVRLICPPEARIYREAPSWGLAPIALPIARKSMRGFRALRRWLQENRCDVL